MYKGVVLSCNSKIMQHEQEDVSSRVNQRRSVSGVVAVYNAPECVCKETREMASGEVGRNQQSRMAGVGAREKEAG